MQPELPQVSPPQTPPVPPVQPAASPQSQGTQAESLYQPARPVTYAAPDAAAAPAPVNPSTVSWEASEYVHIDKGATWLLVFGAVVTIVLGIAIWLSAWTFAVLVLVMAAAMAIFAFRPPHVLHYTLTDSGVQIGDKLFHYDDFKAFGVLQDGAFFTMTLIPVKRFAPALSVYFAEEHGEQIVDLVSEHLPMEDIQPDLIDVIMRRLHF